MKKILLVLLVLLQFLTVPLTGSQSSPDFIYPISMDNPQVPFNTTLSDQITVNYTSVYKQSLSLYVDNEESLAIPPTDATVHLKKSALYQHMITNLSDFWQTGISDNVNVNYSKAKTTLSSTEGNHAEYEKNVQIPIHSDNDYFFVRFDSINFTRSEDELAFAGITFVFATPTKDFQISVIGAYNNYTKNLFDTLVYPDLEKYYFLQNITEFSLPIYKIKTLANVSEVLQLSQVHFTAYRPVGLNYRISINALNFYHYLPSFQNSLSSETLEHYDSESQILSGITTLIFVANVTGYVNITLVQSILDTITLNISRTKLNINYSGIIQFIPAPFDFDTVEVQLPFQIQNSTFISSEFTTSDTTFQKSQIGNTTEEIIVRGNLFQISPSQNINLFYQGTKNFLSVSDHIVSGDVIQKNYSYFVDVIPTGIYIPNFFMQGAAYFLGYNASGFAFLLLADFPLKAMDIHFTEQAIYDPLIGASISITLRDYHSHTQISDAIIVIPEFPYTYMDSLLTILPNSRITNSTVIHGSIIASGYAVGNFSFTLDVNEPMVNWSAESQYLGNNLFSLLISVAAYDSYLVPLTLQINNISYPLTSETTSIFLLSNKTQTIDLTLLVDNLALHKFLTLIPDENATTDSQILILQIIGTAVTVTSFSFVILQYLKKRTQNTSISF